MSKNNITVSELDIVIRQLKITRDTLYVTERNTGRAYSGERIEEIDKSLQNLNNFSVPVILAGEKIGINLSSLESKVFRQCVTARNKWRPRPNTQGE